jgi:hypothetical protein
LSRARKWSSEALLITSLPYRLSKLRAREDGKIKEESYTKGAMIGVQQGKEDAKLEWLVEEFDVGQEGQAEYKVLDNILDDDQERW